MVTHRWPYNRGSRGRRRNEPQPPALSGSPHCRGAEDARAYRGRRCPRAHGRRNGAQPRLDVPVSARQLFLLHLGLSRARGGHRARRRRRGRPAPPVLPREGPGTGDLGWLSLRARRGARDLRLRRGAPDRGARPVAAGARGRPAGALHAARLVRGVGPEDLRRAERSAQARAHRRRRAGRDRRRAAGDRYAAPREGRARDRADAPGRHDLRRRPPPGDGSHPRPAGTSTRSRPSSRTNSCGAARRRSPIRRSSPAGPMPACCTIARTTGSCRTASCC